MLAGGLDVLVSHQREEPLVGQDDLADQLAADMPRRGAARVRRAGRATGCVADPDPVGVLAEDALHAAAEGVDRRDLAWPALGKIGRAHVWTPGPHAHLACQLL